MRKKPHYNVSSHFMFASISRWWNVGQHMQVKPRSLWCWQHRPRRLNPHYHPFIIVFFPPLLFFLSDILMAAVACNYVAIICFLASNWCSIAGMQSQIVSITLPLAWQAHLDYSQTSWSGDTLNVCLNFSWNPNNFYPFHSIHRHSFSHVCPTLRYRVIISLQSQSQEIIDMYFFSPSLYFLLFKSSWFFEVGVCMKSLDLYFFKFITYFPVVCMSCIFNKPFELTLWCVIAENIKGISVSVSFSRSPSLILSPFHLLSRFLQCELHAQRALLSSLDFEGKGKNKKERGIYLSYCLFCLFFKNHL